MVFRAYYPFSADNCAPSFSHEINWGRKRKEKNRKKKTSNLMNNLNEAINFIAAVENS